MKLGGPTTYLTSYTSEFPGYKMPKQYSKLPKIDNIPLINLPMIGKTTYTTAYGPKSSSLAKPQKLTDNIKPRNLWIGDSTYGRHFLPPNPEDYAKRNGGQNDKPKSDPKYAHQHGNIWLISRYDLQKQLCGTTPYHLSGQITPTNQKKRVTD
jgi:hypothetical protein